MTKREVKCHGIRVGGESGWGLHEAYVGKAGYYDGVWLTSKEMRKLLLALLVYEGVEPDVIALIRLPSDPKVTVHELSPNRRMRKFRIPNPMQPGKPSK